MNPVNLFKFLEKEKGKIPSIRIRLILGLSLTPEELNIERRLDLRYTPTKFLPKNLRVRGDLELEGTPIQSLPQGLKVGRDLVVALTSIAFLPPDLQVEKHLWIQDSPLAKKSDEEIRAMLKTGYIKGNIIR